MLVSSLARYPVFVEANSFQWYEKEMSHQSRELPCLDWPHHRCRPWIWERNQFLDYPRHEGWRLLHQNSGRSLRKRSTSWLTILDINEIAEWLWQIGGVKLYFLGNHHQCVLFSGPPAPCGMWSLSRGIITSSTTQGACPQTKLTSVYDSWSWSIWRVPFKGARWQKKLACRKWSLLEKISKKLMSAKNRVNFV